MEKSAKTPEGPHKKQEQRIRKTDTLREELNQL